MENYIHKGKGHLNNHNLYLVTIKDKTLLAFPNVETVLRLLLSLMVTNCSRQGPFSGLEYTKNELRTKILQEKLYTLSIISVESDKLLNLSFQDNINDFAVKNHKKQVPLSKLIRCANTGRLSFTVIFHYQC
jgi:hypothetical protein